MVTSCMRSKYNNYIKIFFVTMTNKKLSMDNIPVQCISMYYNCAKENWLVYRRIVQIIYNNYFILGRDRCP